MAGHLVVDIPASKVKKEITKILHDQGFILSYKFEDTDNNQGNIKIALNLDHKPTIEGAFTSNSKKVLDFAQKGPHGLYYILGQNGDLTLQNLPTSGIYSKINEVNKFIGDKTAEMADEKTKKIGIVFGMIFYATAAQITGSVRFSVIIFMFFFFMFAMVKAMVPRYRCDQLMRLGWKVFLPLSLFMVVVVAGVLMVMGWAP